jgi:hypothetical protein
MELKRRVEYAGQWLSCVLCTMKQVVQRILSPLRRSVVRRLGTVSFTVGLMPLNDT